MIYSLADPTDLRTAIYTPKVEYFEGGCLEVVTEDNELCIYHTEEEHNYICAYNLARLGIYVKEVDNDLAFSEELDN